MREENRACVYRGAAPRVFIPAPRRCRSPAACALPLPYSCRLPATPATYGSSVSSLLPLRFGIAGDVEDVTNDSINNYGASSRLPS